MPVEPMNVNWKRLYRGASRTWVGSKAVKMTLTEKEHPESEPYLTEVRGHKRNRRISLRLSRDKESRLVLPLQQKK